MVSVDCRIYRENNDTFNFNLVSQHFNLTKFFLDTSTKVSFWVCYYIRRDIDKGTYMLHALFIMICQVLIYF